MVRSRQTMENGTDRIVTELGRVRRATEDNSDIMIQNTQTIENSLSRVYNIFIALVLFMLVSWLILVVIMNVSSQKVWSQISSKSLILT